MEESLNQFWDYYQEKMDLEAVNVNELSPLVLAYIGDAFYDLCVRDYVLRHGSKQINRMNKHKTELVCAHAQSSIIHYLSDTGMLTEEETGIYRRGRNAKSVTHAKNASIQDYRRATGFEALIGALYLSGRRERAVELIAAGVRMLEQNVGEAEL